MVTTDHEYQVTQDRARRFGERLAQLHTRTDEDEYLHMRIAAASAQLDELRRELAMWEAGIREEVPGNPDLLPPVEGPVDEAALAAQQKRAEIANIDRQIGIALDRIADWRRHRAWLEREIAELEATPAAAREEASA